MTIKSILENLFNKIEDAANYNITEIMFKPISLFDNTYINAIKTNPKKDRFYLQLSNEEENEKIYTNFYIVDNNFLTDALTELNQYIINDTTNDDFIIRKMTEEKENKQIENYTLFISKRIAINNTKEIRNKRKENKQNLPQFKFIHLGETFKDEETKTVNAQTILEIATTKLN